MPGPDSYERLLVVLRAGVQVPARMIFSILAETERTPADLVVDVFAEPVEAIRSGDDCPECKAAGGVVAVSSRPTKGGLVVRRLACRECRSAVGKQVLPAAAVRRRRKRVR